MSANPEAEDGNPVDGEATDFGPRPDDSTEPIAATKLPFWKSIRGRLLLAMLGATSLPLVVGMLYPTVLAADLFEAAARDSLDRVAKFLDYQASEWRDRRTESIKALAELPSVRAMDAESQALALASVLKTTPGIYTVSTISPEGTNFARGDGGEPKSYGDREYFHTSMAGEPARQVLVSRSHGRPALVVTHPIFAPDSEDEVVGVALMGSFLDAIADQIGASKIGETGFAYAFNEKGQVFARPDRFVELIGYQWAREGESYRVRQSERQRSESAAGEGDEAPGELTLVELLDYPPVAQAIAGQEGPTDFIDHQGVDWLVDAAALGNGWYLIVQQQKAEVLAKTRTFVRSAISIAVICLGLLLAMTWNIANKTSKPIIELTNSAQALSKGDWDAHADEKSPGEIGIFAKSFNVMANELSQTYKEIEDRVARRTAQLKKSNESLAEAREAAEGANRAKSTFLALMSHEIRTPMNAVLGFSELLQDEVKDPKQLSYVNAISTAGGGLLAVINDVLDLSKVEAGKISLDIDVFDIRGLAEEVRVVFAQKAEKIGVDLIVEVEDSVPEGLFLDEARLRQILFNLVSNALKFTEEGSVTVRFDGTLSGEEDLNFNLHIEVQDSGIGIRESDQKRIFAPFTQMTGQDVEKYGGTGLGLAITKRLTELMNGSISLHSEEGQGTRFDLEFPDLHVGDLREKANAQGGPNLGLADLRPGKILVADDQQLNLKLLRSFFENTGHEVDYVENGRALLDRARLDPVDVIITDVVMPDMGGLEAIHKLREDPRTSNIPIVAVTASTMKHGEGEVRSVVEAFLQKPVSRGELAIELSRFLPVEGRLEDAEAPVEGLALEATVTDKSGKEDESSKQASPELYEALCRLQEDRWKRVNETFLIDEVEAFATELTDLETAHPCPALASYAGTLKVQAESFDMEHLPSTMARFPKLVEGLAPSPNGSDLS